MRDRSPRATPLRKLVDWVRFYLCFELDWDVRLHLRKHEVPPLRLSARQGLREQLERHFSAIERGPALQDYDRHARDAFGLLTSGARTADARQRTLRATVDWSFSAI